MKRASKPTDYLLIKAYTNSEWDCCDFAIVHLSNQWKKEQAKRLEYLTPLQGNYHFQSMNFYDTAVDFYRIGENEQPETENLTEGKDWAFVELEKGEPKTFAIPENRLDCYRLALHADGTAYYTAYGKHTGEEFWTEGFSLPQLLQTQ